jgi:FKBP-type peptidyl-prolyl cis-trans isomerase SlpA
VTIVQPGSLLTLHYRLAGPDGADVVSTFNDQPATLAVGEGQLAPAIERHLIGLHEGTEATFELSPGEAFGERSASMLQRVSRRLLAKHGDPEAEYQPGDVVEFPTPNGSGRFAGVVRECANDWLLFDFNHPLAGQAVTFQVRLIGVL